MSIADSILDFNAGRVMYISATGMATPLPGKGKFVLGHSNSDASLLSCKWIPRGDSRDNPTDELLLIPGDVVFKHCTECKTGRVIQMEYKSSGEKHFYWLQAATTGDAGSLNGEDKDIIGKLNELTSTFEGENSDFDMDIESDNITFHSAQEIPESEGPDGSQALPLSDPAPAPAPPQSLNRVFNVLRRQEHISGVNDNDLQRLLGLVPQLASTRSELSEVVSSPYFAQAMDQLVLALSDSPELAREMGLPRTPRSVQDLLDLLRSLE